MAKISDTKEKILDLAEHLFQCKGYDSFSYHDISSELNIRNAAIHYYYPSKEDLGKEIIVRAAERFRIWKSEQEESSKDSWEKLVAFIEMYGKRNLDDNGRICLITSCATAYNILPDGMREEVKIIAEDILGWLTHLFDEGREHKVFDFQGEARDKALTFIASLAAGLQLARLGGKEYFHKVSNQLLLELKKKS